MAKHRNGTIQEILDRHYAKIQERNAKPDGRKTRWTPERRKAMSAAKIAYYDRIGRKPKKTRLARTMNDARARLEELKAKAAKWRSESATKPSPQNNTVKPCTGNELYKTV